MIAVNQRQVVARLDQPTDLYVVLRRRRRDPIFAGLQTGSLPIQRSMGLSRGPTPGRQEILGGPRTVRMGTGWLLLLNNGLNLQVIDLRTVGRQRSSQFFI